jgi:hypothetical protein
MSKLVLAATLLITSVIFGLPHLMIPGLLGPDRPYTPFAVSGVSSLSYDKTSTYAAYINYTALRSAPPYDTDLFESKDVPVPTTSAPFFALGALGRLVGGIDRVFVLCDFVLPPLAVLLLYLLILELAGSRPIALVGSLTTIFISFGPTSFLGIPWLLVRQRADSAIQPLEYSRLLHPELSFTLFAAALFLLWRTVRGGGRVQAVLGGLAGGLQFYTYVYYFPAWLGACALLLVGRRWLTPRAWVAIWLVNLSTWIVSIPFWLSVLESRGSPNFSTRLERHYSDLGHVPAPEKLLYTLACVVIAGIMFSVYVVFDRSADRSEGARPKSTVLLFLACIFAAALAALNSEVITGFNLEAMNHYPNRLIQPLLSLTAFVLVVRPATDFVTRHVRWSLLRPSVWAYGATAILLTIAATRQTLVSTNVAARHELPEEYRLLFDWLNAQTHLDDVVLASARDINELIPVFTHNRVFVPNGERTSASDAEIERRFLIAMRLLQRADGEVYDLLAQDYSRGDPPLGLTYTYFLFVSGHGSYNLGLPEPTLERIVTDYRVLDLPSELGQWRVDYIYGRGSESPATLPGWSLHWVYGNNYGNVWRITRAGA